MHHLLMKKLLSEEQYTVTFSRASPSSAPNPRSCDERRCIQQAVGSIHMELHKSPGAVGLPARSSKMFQENQIRLTEILLN